MARRSTPESPTECGPSEKATAPASRNRPISAISCPARPLVIAAAGRMRTRASRARRMRKSTTAGLSTGGEVSGRAISVVTPPAAAAALALAMVSRCSAPGSPTKARMSMNPGATTSPPQSMTRAPSGAEAAVTAPPRPAMRPSLTNTPPLISRPLAGSTRRALTRTIGGIAAGSSAARRRWQTQDGLALPWQPNDRLASPCRALSLRRGEGKAKERDLAHDEFDVVVVGAGAAGLAAAERLATSGLSHLVLEARERPGGRAWTTRLGNGEVADLGCGWLHSAATNPLAGVAERQGLTLDKSPPPWGRASAQVGPNRSSAGAFLAALGRFRERVDARPPGAPDVACSALLQPGDPFNPLIDAVSTYYSGAELEKVSAVDLAAYEDSGVNWRVREGLGAVVAGLAA